MDTISNLEELYANQMTKYNEMKYNFLINDNSVDEYLRNNQRLLVEQQKTILDLIQLCITYIAKTT